MGHSWGTLALGLMIAGAVASAQPLRASAQDGTGSEAGVFEGAPVESSAPGEDLDRKIRSLRWGVALSSVAVPLGAGLFIGGAVACEVDGVFGSGCTTGEAAAQGIGIAFMGLGTAGLITSAILLRRRKLERRGLHANRRFHWSTEQHRWVF